MDPVFFFDDGGVLNDNRLRGPEWKRLIAAYFIPRYGGTEGEWSRANEVALQEYMHQRTEQEKITDKVDTSFFDHLDIRWLENMFNTINIALPPIQQRLSLAREAIHWILPRVRSGIAGMAQAVRSLAAEGYTLHTASAELEYELDGYLRGMGIREHFDQLYGVDKLGVFKNGPNYFTTIFDRLALQPSQSIFIEDRPSVISMIESAGAVAVQSRLTREHEPVTHYNFEHPAELLQIISEIVAKLPQS